MTRRAIAAVVAGIAAVSVAPAAAEPGVDEPLVVFDEGGPEANATITIEDRQVAFRSSQRAAAGSTSATIAAEADHPVCPDDTGTVRGTYRFSFTTTGDSPRRIAVTADVVGHVDDATALTSFDLVGMDVEVSSGEGQDPFLVLAADATGLSGRDDAVGEYRGTVERTDGDHGVEPNDALALAVLYGRMHVGASLEAGLGQARNGMCVRIEADARGVTMLGPGASTPIDVRVVDAVTGEELDLPVEGLPIDGTVDPQEGTPVPSPAEFTFTAANDARSTYTVYFQVRSRRGGDDVEVVFSTGWAFSGATLTQSFPDLGANVTVWSGFVCGDPLTTPWTFRQRLEGPAPFDHTFDAVPFRVGSGRPDIGTVPMIEPVATPPAGQPPFRLYLDDIAPEEASPATQRVEVQVVPATTECASGGGG